MRKGVSPMLGNEGGSSANSTRVFGIPLEEVTRTHTIGGYEVPVLVKYIVDYIEEHGDLDVEGLFLVNGNAERVEWLRQRFERGEEVELQKDADLPSAVALLRLFLQELPEPVITTAVQAHVLQLHQDYSSEEELFRRLKYLLQQLPQLNYDLLRFLCRFLSSVASLQESWNVGALAAVFGPDIFHLSTEGEELQEQEAVSRVLAELLDNQDGLFQSEDELSTTDYSSINEQITELLDDDKCEDLPQDENEGTTSTPQHCNTEVSASRIIQQTIRAAVEHHFLEFKTSIDQDLSSYTNQGVSASEAGGCHVDGEQQTEIEDLLCDVGDGGTPTEESLNNELDSDDTPDQGSRMDLDQNNINTARQDNQTCITMEGTNIICCDLGSCQCDQNANTSQTNRNHLSPFQPNTDSFPHLQLFPDNQWEDPVPAFKSWHEESDSGEAQLSPLAGRMVPLPPLLPLPLVEEGEEVDSPSSARSHPHLLARRFLDFGAHSAQKFLQQDTGNTSPTKAHRPRRASLGSKDAMRGDSVTHQLTKKLQHIKKKIKQFEEQFEKEKNFKPSHGDKAANPKVLKWMTDLTKIRRQIKGRQHHLFPRSSLRHQALLHSHRRQHVPPCPPPSHHTLTPPSHPTAPSCRRYSINAKQRAESELGPQTRPRSNTLPKSFGSTLEQRPHSNSNTEGPRREETLELIQKRVRGQREDNWPDDIKKMTEEQLSCEKTVLQKNLLHYEGLHGRPVTREERLVMKPLYDRYRLVKQMLTRVSIPPITVSPSNKRRSQTLQPIIEGETAHFWEEIREAEEEEHRGRAEEEDREDEHDEEEEEEEEEGESSGGETPSPDVIMMVDPINQSDMSQSPGPIRGKLEEGSGKLAMDLRLSSSNASSMPELLEQLWKARAEKKQLRKTIREFEEDFYQHNGRNAQKEDRLPMMEEYREYKRIKAKLRLLEVLISKQDSSKSI